MWIQVTAITAVWRVILVSSSIYTSRHDLWSSIKVHLVGFTDLQARLLECVWEIGENVWIIEILFFFLSGIWLKFLCLGWWWLNIHKQSTFVFLFLFVSSWKLSFCLFCAEEHFPFLFFVYNLVHIPVTCLPMIHKCYLFWKQFCRKNLICVLQANN